MDKALVGWMWAHFWHNTFSICFISVWCRKHPVNNLEHFTSYNHRLCKLCFQYVVHGHFENWLASFWYDWRYVLRLWTSSSWVIVSAIVKLDDWRWLGLIMKFNSGKSSSKHCNYINKSIIWKPCVYELLSIYGLVVFAAFVMSKL